MNSAESWQTVAQRMAQRAERQGDDEALTFIEGDGRTQTWTYHELDLRARRLAARLASRFAPESRGLLMAEPGLEYVATFLGCLYADLVPVPAYPPTPLHLERTLGRLRTIAEDSEATFALTTSALMPFTADMDVRVRQEALEWICSEEEDETVSSDGSLTIPSPAPARLAFLQYTSGSTSDPKGVMITHKNLVSNIEMVVGTYGIGREDVMVSWLPPYHDMGLSSIFSPLWSGSRAVLMSPETFLRRPDRWLRALSDYGGTWSVAPNFAYDLCVRRAPPDLVSHLDLSRWRVAINGAEPVLSATLKRFTEVFAPSGFKAETFWPSYGLAESTLLCAAGGLGDASSVVDVDYEALRDGRLVEVAHGAGSRTLVSCGRPPVGARALVVDPLSCEPLAEDVLGEIWVAGDHVGAGYWRRHEESEQTFRARASDGSGPYLRTSDLGALHRGELLVAGRMKDMIIVRGDNYYPQDIERTVEESTPGLRPGCGAAFSVEVEDGPELLAIVQEVSEDVTDHELVVSSIERAVIEKQEVKPDAIVLVGSRTIPKTSSGKIQRMATRRALLDGTLSVVHQWHSRRWEKAAPF